MGFLDKTIIGGIKGLTDSIGSAIDNITTSDDEKLTAKAKLTQIVTTKLTQLAAYQKEVLVAELQGTRLQRNWRPIVMLSFAAIVVYAKFIAPAFGLPNTALEPSFWKLLELGIGGYVVGRSLEKITGKVTENIDLTFLKKKKRKI